MLLLGAQPNGSARIANGATTISEEVGLGVSSSKNNSGSEAMPAPASQTTAVPTPIIVSGASARVSRPDSSTNVRQAVAATRRTI